LLEALCISGGTGVNSSGPQLCLLSISAFQSKGLFHVIPKNFNTEFAGRGIRDIDDITDGGCIDFPLDIKGGNLFSIAAFSGPERISFGSLLTAQHKQLKEVNVVHLLDIFGNHRKGIIEKQVSPISRI